MKGQILKTLICYPEIIKEYGSNKYSVVWDGTDQTGKSVSSGIYFYRIELINGIQANGKMLMVK